MNYTIKEYLFFQEFLNYITIIHFDILEVQKKKDLIARNPNQRKRGHHVENYHRYVPLSFIPIPPFLCPNSKL